MNIYDFSLKKLLYANGNLFFIAFRTTEVTLVCDPKANTPIIKEFIEPPDRPDHYVSFVLPEES